MLETVILPPVTRNLGPDLAVVDGYVQQLFSGTVGSCPTKQRCRGIEFQSRDELNVPRNVLVSFRQDTMNGRVTHKCRPCVWKGEVLVVRWPCLAGGTSKGLSTSYEQLRVQLQ
jgi:hypothetical protein